MASLLGRNSACGGLLAASARVEPPGSTAKVRRLNPPWHETCLEPPGHAFCLWQASWTANVFMGNPPGMKFACGEHLRHEICLRGTSLVRNLPARNLPGMKLVCGNLPDMKFACGEPPGHQICRWSFSCSNLLAERRSNSNSVAGEAPGHQICLGRFPDSKSA